MGQIKERKGDEEEEGRRTECTWGAGVGWMEDWECGECKRAGYL
jgi:hypothetical protein